MQTFNRLAISALMAASVSTPALSGSHAADLPPAVKARQAHMQLQGFNIGILAGMARGNTEYNAEAAVAAASNLADLSNIDESAYWVPGTDSDSIEGTRALTAIFTDDFSKVQEKIDAVNAAATALMATAGDGLEALQAGMGPLGGACGACHEAYRKPRE